MKNLHKLFVAAKSGGFGLWKLNLILGFGIPFNRPHGIKIIVLADEKVQTFIPFKRKNLNHIKGIHACGLATAAEYATGLLLLNALDPAKYRIIMQSLEMLYHYQGKQDVTATFEFSKKQLDELVVTPLKHTDVIYVKCQVELHDSANNHIATGYTNWQIKNWSKVKTVV